MVSKTFGNSCTSYGLGIAKVLNTIKTQKPKTSEKSEKSEKSQESEDSYKHDDSRKAFVSPVGLIQALDILRTFMSRDSRFYQTISNLIYSSEEDSEIKELVALINSNKKELEPNRFALSFWTHSGRLLEEMKTRLDSKVPGNERLFVGALSSKSASDSRKWAKKLLPWKPKKIEINLENINSSLLVYSISYFNSSFDYIVNKIKDKNIIEFNEKLGFYENDIFKAIKLYLENKTYFILLCLPKNKNSTEKILNHLCEPQNWLDFQKINCLKNRKNINARLFDLSGEFNMTFQSPLLQRFDLSSFKEVSFDRILTPKFAEKKLSEEKSDKNGTKTQKGNTEILKTGKSKEKESKTPITEKGKKETFDLKLVHTVMFEIKSHWDKKRKEISIRSSEKKPLNDDSEKIDFILDQKCVFFIHHDQSNAMILGGVIDPADLSSDQIKKRVMRNENSTFRAGKSPPRGDMNIHLSLNNGKRIKSNRKEDDDESVINRKLIPCMSLSETGGCTYGKLCRFSHDVIAM